MASYAGINIGPSDIRRVQDNTRRGGSYKQGWGLETVTMGTTLSVPEARRRLRQLGSVLKDKATEMLLEASKELVDEWKLQIDAEGYGPESATGGSDLGLREESVEFLEEKTSRTTGRYYNSIRNKVDQDLEVHVGSDIPRPSGRGLEVASYPELLEYGTSQFEGMYILTHALAEAAPAMEAETVRIYNILLKRVLMQGSPG